jgi:hypothetical protein
MLADVISVAAIRQVQIQAAHLVRPAAAAAACRTVAHRLQKRCQLAGGLPVRRKQVRQACCAWRQLATAALL